MFLAFRIGRLDPERLLGLATQLDLRRAEALVLSACVQMPPPAAIRAAEDRSGLPVLSAAAATASPCASASACRRRSTAQGGCWPAD